MRSCARVLHQPCNSNLPTLSFNPRPRVMAWASPARTSPSPDSNQNLAARSVPHLSVPVPSPYPSPPPRQSPRAHRHVRREQDGAAGAGEDSGGQGAGAGRGRGGVSGADTAVVAAAQTCRLPTAGVHVGLVACLLHNTYTTCVPHYVRHTATVLEHFARSPSLPIFSIPATTPTGVLLPAPCQNTCLNHGTSTRQPAQPRPFPTEPLSHKHDN